MVSCAQIPPPSHLFLLSFLNFLPYKVPKKLGMRKASGIKEENDVYLGQFIYSHQKSIIDLNFTYLFLVFYLFCTFIR